MRKIILTAPIILLALSQGGEKPAYSAAADAVRLPGHTMSEAKNESELVGRHSSDGLLQISISLKGTNPEALADRVARQQDPKDPLFQKTISPRQFANTYGPAAADSFAVELFLKSHGFTMLGSNSAFLLRAEATAATVESAFQIQLNDYRTASGQIAYAPNLDPALPANLASKVDGIIGLTSMDEKESYAVPATVPGGGYTPSDLRHIYGLDQIPNAGDGETIALVEFGGYDPADIEAYIQKYRLDGTKPIRNVMVDGYDGKIAKTQVEVTLDIELALAVAPRAQIIVYEGFPASKQHPFSQVLSRIANDNLASVVSMSFGAPEYRTPKSEIVAENLIFQQMALQNQSMFAASGDSGAYAGNKTSKQKQFTTPRIGNPASQPYVHSVGGTWVNADADFNFLSESSWGKEGAGGGGGISSIWGLPAWQSGLANKANMGSSSHRMIPDVSLNAAFKNGYAIIVKGKDTMIGGTSAAAPIFAAFTSLVNQTRISRGLPRLGFYAPSLYRLAKSPAYFQAFHDVEDHSTNLLYPATPGYDLSTGLGSFRAQSLWDILTTEILPPNAPLAFAATPEMAAREVTVWEYTSRSQKIVCEIFHSKCKKVPVRKSETFFSGSANLTWKATAGEQKSFIIERAALGKPFSRVAVVAEPNRSVALHGLEANAEYRFRIRAEGAGSDSPNAEAWLKTP